MKYGWLIVLLFTTSLPAQKLADILITHGKIIDGSGNPWFYGDIAIKNGIIIDIGQLTDYTATTTIDATGLYIAPGFIDVHTHIEGDEVKNPLAANFIYDGVTTVITGNCGLSKVDTKAYLYFLDSLHLAVNSATLIGHNDIRKAVMGRANRPPTADELTQMEQLVTQAMQSGAVGLSTGLIYIPGTYASTAEITALAKVCAQYNGVYTTHMRYEGDSVLYAIQEALAIGKAANIPVEISHFKVSGQNNWGRSKETLALIQQARQEGIDVTIDQYPYTASSTSLSTLLPDWVQSDGEDSLRTRLQNPTIAAMVKKQMLASLQKRKLAHYSYAFVANYPPDTTLNGKNIEAINLLWHRKHTAISEAQTVIDLLLKSDAGMVFHGMSEEDINRIMQYPFNMFASDASIRILYAGIPHPRGYGTNARVLGKYVREQQIITLEEAIRRMTSLPAQKYHFTNRGLLRTGFAADIVVFNADTVSDLSTYQKPHQYSTGFQYILVNGAIALYNGKQTQLRNGKVLYGAGKKE
ncbi:N-acyl-D-amino-acid deacylase family protein [Limnovirga soli]|uniref:Amidohydrolase family protein n=1 Tax=Limnovirga soli TaxID=2656915 RepID=A0A8J8FD20_9BACT|nr:D-aminoacylase [Limnovirga soli]NNV54134.1 amidohydrolase family protein [Limnovirga soli]